jgi:hypothetical protein
MAGPAVRFDGPDVTAKDAERLSSQLLRVERLMQDGEWRTLASIASAVGGSEAGVSARLRDLRKPRFGGYQVERRRIVRFSLGLWQYRLRPPVPTGQGALWTD